MKRATPVSNRASAEAALASPTTHRLMSKRGYVKAGPLIMPVTGTPGRCNPPKNSVHGSIHLIQPPQGGPAISFTWHAKANCWMNLQTNAKRMGFPPDYLSRWGWVYSSVVTV